MVNWLHLPDDVVNFIAQRLTHIDDLVRLRAVCKSMQSVIIVQTNESSFIPWVLLPEKDEEKCREPGHEFLDESDEDDENEESREKIEEEGDEEENEDENEMIEDENRENNEETKNIDEEREVLKEENQEEKIKEEGDEEYQQVVFHVKEVADGVRVFWDLSSKMFYKVFLPEIHRRRCWGSPFGWLFTIGSDLKIHLFNPLSRIQIALPPQPTLPDQYETTTPCETLRKNFISKVCLAKNPSSSLPTTVMVICSHSCVLAFATPEDESWTRVQSQYKAYSDLIFFQDKFYVVDRRGVVRVCEITTLEPKSIEFVQPPEGIWPQCESIYYLVEMSGDLHLIARAIDEEDEYEDDENYRAFRYKTYGFEIYKLNMHTKAWTRVWNLGEYALFVGNNTSFSMSTFNNLQLKRNQIYYTDDHSESFMFGGGRDMGVFDLDKKKFSRLNKGTRVLSTFSPPLFLSPSLY